MQRVSELRETKKKEEEGKKSRILGLGACSVLVYVADKDAEREGRGGGVVYMCECVYVCNARVATLHSVCDLMVVVVVAVVARKKRGGV